MISFIKNLTTHNQVPENQIFVNNTAVDLVNLLYATNQAKYLVSWLEYGWSLVLEWLVLT